MYQTKDKEIYLTIGLVKDDSSLTFYSITNAYLITGNYNQLLKSNFFLTMSGN